MAITYDEIRAYLDQDGVKHEWDADRNAIMTGSATENYTHPNGGKAVSLVVRLEEDGEYFKLIAPNLYSYKEGPHKLALFQTLLSACWKTKLIQFEYDESDGEVRCIVEFPVEDGTLTKRQFTRCFGGIVRLIDEYDAEIRAAMTSGRPDLAVVAIPESIGPMYAEFMRLLEECAKETEKANGGVGLEE